jgi:ribosomal protein L31
VIMLLSTVLLFSAVTAAPAPSPTAPIIDPGTVQSVEVAEVTPTPECPAVLDKDGRHCTSARRFELRRIERERALAMINAGGAPKACRQVPTHAFVVRTTKGTKVVEVSFQCHTIGGRQLNQQTEAEVASFMRSQGLVTGL